MRLCPLQNPPARASTASRANSRCYSLHRLQSEMRCLRVRVERRGERAGGLARACAGPGGHDSGAFGTARASASARCAVLSRAMPLVSGHAIRSVADRAPSLCASQRYSCACAAAFFAAGRKRGGEGVAAAAAAVAAAATTLRHVTLPSSWSPGVRVAGSAEPRAYAGC